MTLYKQIENILLKQGKFHISLELDRIKNILSLFDNPQEKLKIIHVAGTNGKGSTCSLINEILLTQGYKVGLYTSPHLLKYNERIKINNIPISDKDFLNLIKKINDKAKDNNIELTEFEILTATMFIYFEKQKINYAVIEVGLGGRFDATNCINSPILSIITSISKDHTERLGNNIEQIAYEKSGIIKQNVPVIFSYCNLGKGVLEKIAKEKGSIIYYPDNAGITHKRTNKVIYGKDSYTLNLLGKYQAENTALALCAASVLQKSGIKINKKSIRTALKNVKWAGRLEWIKDKNIIIDGCHNPDGARVLRESLDYYFPNSKRTFIYTSLKNKDYKQIQNNLFRKDDTIYHFKTNSHSFISANDVINLNKSVDIAEIKDIIKNKNKKDLLIICGSLYAIGDILGKIDLCF